LGLWGSLELYSTLLYSAPVYTRQVYFYSTLVYSTRPHPRAFVPGPVDSSLLALALGLWASGPFGTLLYYTLLTPLYSSLLCSPSLSPSPWPLGLWAFGTPLCSSLLWSTLLYSALLYSPWASGSLVVYSTLLESGLLCSTLSGRLHSPSPSSSPWAFGPLGLYSTLLYWACGPSGLGTPLYSPAPLALALVGISFSSCGLVLCIVTNHPSRHQ
jgi:hypothetical protein